MSSEGSFLSQLNPFLRGHKTIFKIDLLFFVKLWRRHTCMPSQPDSPSRATSDLHFLSYISITLSQNTPSLTPHPHPCQPHFFSFPLTFRYSLEYLQIYSGDPNLVNGGKANPPITNHMSSKLPQIQSHQDWCHLAPVTRKHVMGGHITAELMAMVSA